MLTIVPVISDSYDPTVTAISTYAETFWLPVTGPTPLWLARKLHQAVEASPAGCYLDEHVLAASVGVPWQKARDSILRLVTFHLAVWNGQREDQVTFHMRWPRISDGSLSKLPPAMIAQHREWAGTSALRRAS